MKLTETGREIVGASVRGVSHIRRNKPNQDAIGGFVGGAWALAVVSDGHGAEQCFRSDRGSHFVVAALEAVCLNLVRDRSPAEIGLAEFMELPALVVEDWRRRVTADARADPDPRLEGAALFESYGATCVAALIGEDLSYLIQIGDGDLLAGAAGGALSRPLPDDEGLVGEQTYSICLPEAVALFRTLLLRAPHPLARPDFISVSSDGLSKSFGGLGEFQGAMRQWRELAAQRGLTWIEPQLEAWLSECSERGSKDDTSLLLYNRKLIAPTD